MGFVDDDDRTTAGDDFSQSMSAIIAERVAGDVDLSTLRITDAELLNGCDQNHAGGMIRTGRQPQRLGNIDDTYGAKPAKTVNANTLRLRDRMIAVT